MWKEFREQGLIALTLMVLGAGVLVAAATLADPPAAGAGPADVIRYLGAGRLATLLLAVTAGTVCGGALFAAEREAGTMGFLESLPVARWDLWRAKLSAGSMLVAVQVGFVVAVAAALGLIETTGWAVAVIVYALLAFVWGLLGSTLARTTLGSVGVAVPAASVASIMYLFPVMVFFHHPGTNMPRPEGALLFLGLMFATPLGWSALRFTRPDRDRAADDPNHTARLPGFPFSDSGDHARIAPSSDHEVPAAGRARFGLKALGWLAARQLVGPGAVLSGFAILFGLILLLPTIQPALVWPALALAAGVLAGVTVFADEQGHGTARFWGEQRLPVGRVWAVKLLVHAVFAVWLVALVALPSVVRAAGDSGRTVRGGLTLSSVFRTLLFDTPHLGARSWYYLIVPLGYGFAAGHVCGLMFRKPVVAAGVAGLVGGTASALWAPSLLAGGVRPWQVWVPPALALLTARFLVRAWTADRLATRAPITTFAAGAGVAALVMAAAIGYRVVEVPDRPDAEDDVRYVAGLAPFDEKDAGRGFRTAAERFARIADGLAPDRAGPPGLRGARPARIEDQIDDVARAGWPTRDPSVGDWLTRVYTADRPTGEGDETWYVLAARSARQSTGLYEHPLRTGTAAGTVTLLNGRRMGGAVVAHGLQSHAAGDPAALPDDLRTALALGQSLQNGSILVALQHGNEVVRAALAGTDHWLAALDGRPDLLRAALAAVLEDEPAGPFDPTPHLLAERYVTRELTKAPGQWLPAMLTPGGEDKEVVASVADLIALAWSVPWERERGRRLVGLGFEAGLGQEEHNLVRGRPGSVIFNVRLQTPIELAEIDRQLRTYRRAVQLKLAVRLYQEEKGSAPPDLTALVAEKYIPVVPADPYDGLPFRYRVSAGEELQPPPSPVAVPPAGMTLPGTPTPLPRNDPPAAEPTRVLRGQPVIWSVGPNRRDGGGRNPPAGPGGLGRGEDIVFLVPPPPGRK
ncbi:MAG: hypothetical protein JWO38_5650 [Gemmataceae bacterium]|nr:hypothetical protein [Gemmataceae bacterium]